MKTVTHCLGEQRHARTLGFVYIYVSLNAQAMPPLSTLEFLAVQHPAASPLLSLSLLQREAPVAGKGTGGTRQRGKGLAAPCYWSISLLQWNSPADFHCQSLSLLKKSFTATCCYVLQCGYSHSGKHAWSYTYTTCHHKCIEGQRDIIRQFLTVVLQVSSNITIVGN